MNRIFTLISFLLLSISSFAERNEARLSITSMSKVPVTVMIDGQRVQDNDNEIRISNLNPGYHRIQIYTVNNKKNGWNRGRDKQPGQLIYNNTVNIRNGMHTDIIINRFGHVFTDEQAVDDRNDDWRDDSGWNNSNDQWNNGQGNGNSNSGWNQGMNNDMFQQLKQQVRRESFDNKRIDILRSVLPGNGVTASQVKELTQLLDFEQNKLELAKFAYRYTSDRRNYFVVNDVFEYGNSKTELTRYISNYRD